MPTLSSTAGVILSTVLYFKGGRGGSRNVSARRMADFPRKNLLCAA